MKVSKNLSMPLRKRKAARMGGSSKSLKIWWRLLELGRDGLKTRVEAGPDAPDGTNDHNRNAGGDQAILNRSMRPDTTARYLRVLNKSPSQ
jgi:hypothetical protein